jgi:hypothetical protein
VGVGVCPYCGGLNEGKIKGTKKGGFTEISWTSDDDNQSGSTECSDDGNNKVDSMTYEYDVGTGKVKWTHKEDEKVQQTGEVDPPTDSPRSLPRKGTGDFDVQARRSMEYRPRVGVPSLTEWGLIGLGMLLAGSLAWMIRKKGLGNISA